MSDLVTVTHPPGLAGPAPALITELGPAAAFAWDEFFSGMVRNRHTRAGYLRAVRRFLTWLEPTGVPLPRVRPGMIGGYLDSLSLSAPSKKLELAALRRFFDVLVVRHVIVLNPALSVRGERFSVVEGTTPEITPGQTRTLLAAIDAASLVGLRDRAVIGCLAFTAARAGAVAGLTRGSLSNDGTQYRLRFREKGGKRRDIPVRHDLEVYLLSYLSAAGLTDAPPDSPLFRTADGKRDRLSANGVTGVDVCRLVKRRVKAAGLPMQLSPHSFRVGAATSLLNQNVSLTDVQFLLGHSDPRTTRLYDRRQQTVTRNLVERIDG
jgi:site-specific recombinase XerD